MADKTLKSITIDGVTMGMEDHLGIVYWSQALKNIPTANADVIGAEYQVTEPGTYNVFAHWVFASSSTTGNRVVRVAIGLKTSGASSYAAQKWQTEASAGNQYIHVGINYNVTFKPSQVPGSIACIGRSSATTTNQDYTTLYVTRIPYTGDYT